jgi:hypothetical protein
MDKKIFGSKYWFKIIYLENGGKARSVWVKAKNENMARLKFLMSRPNKNIYILSISRYTKLTKKLKKQR